MLAIFMLSMNVSSSYTECVPYFGEVGCREEVILYGTEISFVSLLGAWSRTVSLVIQFLILAISRMGFIKLY